MESKSVEEEATIILSNQEQHHKEKFKEKYIRGFF
jgi:hypothetical protein